MGQKQVEQIQKEFIHTTTELNREWAERLKAEAELAAEFAGKFTTAKSIPEMLEIWQDWIRRRMDMFAADIQRFTTVTARLIPGGSQGDRS